MGRHLGLVPHSSVQPGWGGALSRQPKAHFHVPAEHQHELAQPPLQSPLKHW